MSNKNECSKIGFELNEDDAEFLFGLLAHHSEEAKKLQEDVDYGSDEWGMYEQMHPVADRLLGSLGRAMTALIVEETARGERERPTPPLHHRGAYDVPTPGEDPNRGNGIPWKSLTRETVKLAAECIDGCDTIEFCVFAAFVDELMREGETLGDYEERVGVNHGASLQ